MTPAPRIPIAAIIKNVFFAAAWSGILQFGRQLALTEHTSRSVCTTIHFARALHLCVQKDNEGEVYTNIKVTIRTVTYSRQFSGLPPAVYTHKENHHTSSWKKPPKSVYSNYTHHCSCARHKHKCNSGQKCVAPPWCQTSTKGDLETSIPNFMIMRDAQTPKVRRFECFTLYSKALFFSAWRIPVSGIYSRADIIISTSTRILPAYKHFDLRLCEFDVCWPYDNTESLD
jgi:hypothetical protein